TYRKAMISIIIPSYQHGNSIKQCLDALFAQTYRNFEVIVVNDGSTDNTKEILRRYNHPITVVEQVNSGANAARNKGAKLAKGELLLFCDADLIANSNMLLEMKQALDSNPNAAFVYSDFMWGLKTFKLFPYSKETLQTKNYIHTSSLLLKQHFPGFDESIKRLQDWDLWLTMSESGYKGVYIPKILFKVLPRKSGISGWLPSFVYKIPWHKFGISIKRLDSYKQAEQIIRKKHSLF
ncbi:glycosyltransferase family 2 protein, partial [Dolichospermum sp. ST_sed2]|nr:glycosyltransferase family 2 protein [Dolichospermum sp. ST_sed2]